MPILISVAVTPVPSDLSVTVGALDPDVPLDDGGAPDFELLPQAVAISATVSAAATRRAYMLAPRFANPRRIYDTRVRLSRTLAAVGELLDGEVPVSQPERST